MDSLKGDLEDIFRTVFGDEELHLTEAMTAEDIDGWDSLAHLNLIVAIEKRFGVRFATAEISRLKSDGSNVGTLLELLVRKLKQTEGNEVR
jgi:acyl carrier protein